MKCFVFFILMSILPVNSYSQKCIISNSKENTLYAGLSNLIAFAVDGHSCKDFIIISDNGKLEPTDEACTYLATADKVGVATISVISKATHKTISTIKIRVKKIPEPVAMLDRKTGGNISKNVFKAQLGLLADILSMDIEVHIIVTGFNVTAFRKSRVLWSKYCESNLFNEEIKQAMGGIEIGDKVVFSNITYKGAANDGILQPIEFTITE